MSTWNAPYHQSLLPHLFHHQPFPSSMSTSIPTSTHSESLISLSDQMLPSGFSTPMMQSPAYPNPGFLPESEIKQEDGVGVKKKGKALLRRYKTPSPQILRQRRCAANERERRRMTTLNTAYDKLRTVLPECDVGRRLSKFDTLRMAQEYISHLDKILNGPSKRTVSSQ